MTQTYAAYWQVGGGYATTLILRNQDPQNAAAVNVILYSQAGQVVSGTGGQTGFTAQVQLPANGTQQVALGSLIPADGAVHTGGLAVQVNTLAGLSGQAMITNTSNGSSVYMPLNGGYALDSENALYASWWLADAGSDGNITLFNTSSQAIVVTPSITVQGATQAGGGINLASNATQTVSLRSLLAQVNRSSATMGSLTLNYTGPVHALQPALVLENNTTGFWITSAFHAHHSQSSTSTTPAITGTSTTSATSSTPTPGHRATRWQFADLKLQWSGTTNPLHGYALLSNGTKTAMDVGLEAHFTSATAKDPMQRVQLPITTLGPLETKVVDLSQFVSNGTITGNPTRLGLVASHAGAPGDLAVTMFSTNPTSSLAFPAPGSVLSAAAVDIGYFHVANKKESPKAVRNPFSTAMQGQVILYYMTANGAGSYHFPVMQLAANSDQKIKLGQISRVPDARGLLAPKGTTSGIAVLVGVPVGSTSAAAAPQELCENSCAAAAVTTTTTTSDTPPSCEQVSVTVLGEIFTQTKCIHFNEHKNQNCDPPEVSSVQASSGTAGTLVKGVTISGDFFPRDAQVLAGNFINVQNPQWVNENTITADFDIAYDPDAVGPQTIDVTGSFGQSNSNVTFTVNKPLPLVIEGELSPNSGVAGTDVSGIQIAVGPFMNGTQPGFQDGDQINVTGGIIATVDSHTKDGQFITATFHIPFCGAFGTQKVTLTDVFGQTSTNFANFSVTGTSTSPQITSINPGLPPPNDWQAGYNSQPVTIQGTGFGCSPSLQITDPNGALTFTPAVVVGTDGNGQATAIQTLVTIDPSDSSEPATVVVFNNDGGLGGGSAQASLKTGATSTNKAVVTPAVAAVAFMSSPPDTVQIDATPAPKPRIRVVSNDTDLTNLNAVCSNRNLDDSGSTIDYVIGQLVEVVACVDGPNNTQITDQGSGLRITQQSWSGPKTGTIIGSFAVTTKQVTVNGQTKTIFPTGTVTDAVLSKMFTTFYWLSATSGAVPGQLTYSYQLSNGQRNSNNVTFNVVGPTQISVTVPRPAPVSIVPDAEHDTNGNFFPELEAGNSVETIKGIEFNLAKDANGYKMPTANGTTYHGEFSWLQLLAPRVDQSFPGVNNTCTGLDNAYPYPTVSDLTDDGARSAFDIPGILLAPQFGEAKFSMNSTMWLQFKPDPSSLYCSNAAAICTMPVPLGSVNWLTNGDTINTLKTQQNQTTWTDPVCGATTTNPASNPFKLRDPSIPYPSWSHTFVSLLGCQ
jgi:hypothetical protein